MLLQGEWPFEESDATEAQKLVSEGHRPDFYIDIWNSTDPVDQALKSIMIRCHEQDPSDRPSAREVEMFLKEKIGQLDPGRLEGWGEA
jgi:serine/threonine protein kinase